MSTDLDLNFMVEWLWKNVLQNFTFKSISQQVKYLGHCYLTFRYILEGTWQTDTCHLPLTLILRSSDFCLIFAFNVISLQLYLVCLFWQVHVQKCRCLSNTCHLTLTSISWLSNFQDIFTVKCINQHLSYLHP